MSNGEISALAGKVAIVTGATGGIGRAICEALIRERAIPVVVDLDPRRVGEFTAEIREKGSIGEPLGVVGDVRKERDMEEMARLTLARYGRIDILVACAGILRPQGSSLKPMAELTTEEWDTVLDTNLKGVFLSNRAVLPAMIAQKSGQIINFSSVSGKQGRAHDSAYCASKFAVIGLSESLAEEVRQYGVKVQVLLPGAVDTPFWEQNGPIPPPPDALPPERVADLIVFLLALPEDTVLVNPVIAPFRSRQRRAGRAERR